MSRSQPKPKIIYKNLEDVIKNNSLCRNSSSKRYNTQRINTQTLADISNTNNAHKFEPKQIKYIKVNRTQSNDNNQNNGSSSVGLYSQCYNQIDAIFTQLQDFFCQSKQKVLQQVRNMLRNKTNKKKDEKKIRQKVEDIKKMSDYIKHISKYFIQGEIPDMTQHLPQNNSTVAKHTGIAKSTVPTQIYQQQSNKLTHMSLKNSKIRANRRGQLINNRKKTVYQLILQQKQSKLKAGNSLTKKKVENS